VDRVENEAVRLALDLGYREETEAYIRYGVDAYGWDSATVSTLDAIIRESGAQHPEVAGKASAQNGGGLRGPTR
jgi:hypothetical protein